MKRSTRPLFAAVAAAVLVQIGPAAAAKLWVKNETRQSLSVFVDASRRCELAMEKSCTIELTRGSHQLRLQRSDGLNWQASYNYKADDIVHCFVTAGAVNCSRTGGLFD